MNQATTTREVATVTEVFCNMFAQTVYKLEDGRMIMIDYDHKRMTIVSEDK